MKKLLLISLAILMVLAPIASAEGQADVMAEAQKSFQPFELDGKEVKIGGYLINSNNYYKLRDLAALLNGTDKQFNVIFDNEKKQIALELGKPYEKLDTDLQEMKHDKATAKMVTNTILVDGKEVDLKAAFIDKNNYVKLRDLGTVVGFLVGYNKETKTIIVDTKSEAKVEEKTEEKKEEKKEEVKNADPNATVEEIKAFLADSKLTNDYSINDNSELKEKEDGGRYIKFYSEDGVEQNNPIVKYSKSNNENFMDQVKAQTEYMYSANKPTLFFSTSFMFEFVKRERLLEDKIEVLDLLNCLNFSIDNKVKAVLEIDPQTGALVLPFTKKDESGETSLIGSQIGRINVVASYDDGSELNGSEIGDYRTIPVVHKDSKAKLKSIFVMFFINQEVYGMRFFVI